ncbi:MAG: ABC transporter permease [Polaromonas sp.]|nr:ABC transporter permease [Polaromonas sp.]
MASTSSTAPSAGFRRYLQRERSRRLAVRGSQLALLVVTLVVWEVAARLHWVNPLLTSYPSAIVPTALELLRNGTLLQDTWSTLGATLVGFAISFVVGIAVAAALWWSEFLYRVIDPFLVIANAVPKMALVPIFYLWLGSDKTTYGMSVAVAIFVVILVAYDGFSAIDPNKIKLARTFGATRWQTLLKIVLPGSAATLIAAAKMSIGLCLVGVIVGEFQSAEHGLGFLILNGSQVFKLNVVMAAVAVLTLISALLYVVIFAIEVRIARKGGL